MNKMATYTLFVVLLLSCICLCLCNPVPSESEVNEESIPVEQLIEDSPVEVIPEVKQSSRSGRFFKLFALRGILESLQNMNTHSGYSNNNHYGHTTAGTGGATTGGATGGTGTTATKVLAVRFAEPLKDLAQQFGGFRSAFKPHDATQYQSVGCSNRWPNCHRSSTYHQPQHYQPQHHQTQYHNLPSFPLLKLNPFKGLW